MELAAHRSQATLPLTCSSPYSISEHIIVAGTSKNAAKEGQAATPAQIWSGEYAMVCKIATSVDMREPCIGRCFHWSADGSSIGGTVETYRDEARYAERLSAFATTLTSWCCTQRLVTC